MKVLAVIVSFFGFSNFSFGQTPLQVTPSDILIYERSEDYWNSWGKTFTTEQNVTKNPAGHVLHTDGNTTQIFDPNTFAFMDAVSMFDLKIETNKKDAIFEKGVSWSVFTARPYSLTGECMNRPLEFKGKMTSHGESVESVLINGSKIDIRVISTD